MNRQRLEFAAAGFLDEMRRQFILLNPDTPSPVKPLLDYPPEQRSALMAAIGRAIRYSEPGADAAFAEWQRRRAQVDPDAAPTNPAL